MASGFSPAAAVAWLALLAQGADAQPLLPPGATGLVLRPPVAEGESALLIAAAGPPSRLWVAHPTDREFLPLVDLPLAPRAMTLLGGGAAVVVAGDGVAVVSLAAGEERPRGATVVQSVPLQGARVSALACDERRLYLGAGDSVLRARHIAGELGGFQRMASMGQGRVVTGLAVSPDGYVVALLAGDDAGVALVFVPPDGLGPPPQEMSTGLKDAAGLAYAPAAGPGGESLYTLGASRAGEGLHRLDAATDANGHPAARATLVMPLEGATALAPGPAGGVYVTGPEGLRLFPPAP